MILFHGDTAKLKGLDWCPVGIRHDKGALLGQAFHRLVAEIPGIFRNSPVELFIPISGRDLHSFTLSTDNILFARSTDKKALWRLKSVTSLEGVQTTGESARLKDAIFIPDEQVQPLIARARRDFESFYANIKEGSFVRIADGQWRDFCGTVESIRSDFASVTVELKTKVLQIETPLGNLLDLSDVPECLRVWYYSFPMFDTDPKLIEEDLHFTGQAKGEEFLKNYKAVTAPRVRHRYQKSTNNITGRTRELLLQGERSDDEIRAIIIDEIKTGLVRAPKSYRSLSQLIRSVYLIAGRHFNGRLFSHLKLKTLFPGIIKEKGHA
jgi:hypothetical protein